MMFEAWFSLVMIQRVSWLALWASALPARSAIWTMAFSMVDGIFVHAGDPGGVIVDAAGHLAVGLGQVRQQGDNEQSDGGQCGLSNHGKLLGWQSVQAISSFDRPL